MTGSWSRPPPQQPRARLCARACHAAAADVRGDLRKRCCRLPPEPPARAPPRRAARAVASRRATETRRTLTRGSGDSDGCKNGDGGGDHGDRDGGGDRGDGRGHVRSNLACRYSGRRSSTLPRPRVVLCSSSHEQLLVLPDGRPQQLARQRAGRRRVVERLGETEGVIVLAEERREALGDAR
uniref:Uncharacterized protein n=1 Tax=Prymnesium polylepis TaxID=72548 RepID=A0A7S4HUW7_9EUKA